jgi:valyl-tRNA synthetase
MKTKYDDWVKGLKWDWSISRERYYGVPFPVWYCKKCDKIILAKEKDLPVDPLKDKPKEKCSCGSKDFLPEKDVMDTWMTSSMTPFIISKWREKDEIKGVFPNSLRPQAFEIIRTWAFYSIVKALYHANSIPWKDIMISGHGLDSKGRKMSKRLGNIILPEKIIEKYGADALRFWAASANLGSNLPFQEKDVITGQKIAKKLWNAARFSQMHLKDFKGTKPKKLELMDEWILTKMQKTIKKTIKAFECYEFGKAKLETEIFFMKLFADNYLEIIKDRLYNPNKRGNQARISAQFTLHYCLKNSLKLFAPIMPFITEEIFEKMFARDENTKSIHLSKFPEIEKKLINENSEKIGDKFIEVLGKIRAFKAQHQKSLKTKINLTLPEKEFELLKKTFEDLKAVANAEIIKGKELKIEFA